MHKYRFLWVIVLLLTAAVPKGAGQDPRYQEAVRLSGESERLVSGGKPKEALPLAERSLKLCREALDPSDLRLADAIANLGSILDDLQEFQRAIALQQEALQIRKRVLGPKHIQVAYSLNYLAVAYKNMGDYDAALDYYQRSLLVAEGAIGPDNPELVVLLTGFGNACREAGRLEAAGPLLQRALRLAERSTENKDQKTLSGLSNLGAFYLDLGRYELAKPLLERAMRIAEHNPRWAPTEKARISSGLALLYRYTGEFDKARALIEGALPASGDDPGLRRALLSNLGGIYRAAGQPRKALPIVEEVLAAAEKTYGPQHPQVAEILNNQGTVLHALGELLRAEACLQRAVAVGEKTFGENGSMATYLINLAAVQMSMGRTDKARELFARALALRQARLPAGHPQLAAGYLNVARAELLLNQPTAIEGFERAFSTAEESLRSLRLITTESRVAALLEGLRSSQDVYYSLAMRTGADERARRLALSVALLRQGRDADEAADTSWALARSLPGDAARAKLERLRMLRRQFAASQVARGGALSPAQRQQAAKLQQDAQALEEELALQSVALRQERRLPPADAIAAAVARSLPRDGALIQYVWYKPFSNRDQGGNVWFTAPRYQALVLGPEGKVGAVDLGTASTVDAVVKAWLALLQRPGAEAEAQRAALQAQRLLLAPLLPLLEGRRGLWVVPDGSLHFVPFEALHDGHGYLLDQHAVIYLTSGRDLLRGGLERKHDLTPLIFANPSFSAQPETTLVAERAPLRGTQGLPKARFAALPGTQREAEAIRRVFPRAVLTTGVAATEEALLGASAPDLLHIATHGVFLSDMVPALDERDTGSRRVAVTASSGNPLLRSMLVMAGAAVQRRPPPGGEVEYSDGLVTALEVAGMDLWGTQLVVLSACESGRGDARVGQGVYGLRRAFFIAGAEALVTSLWKVSDDVTAEFMKTFYEGLAAGRGREEALHGAALRTRERHAHPYYWAPFILIGRGDPLLGQSQP